MGSPPGGGGAGLRLQGINRSSLGRGGESMIAEADRLCLGVADFWKHPSVKDKV